MQSGPSQTGSADRDDVGLRSAYEAQRDAMVAGDASALGDLLADGFTLTHMTGYVQDRDDWLADVRSGRMTYHSIEDVSVSVSDDEAHPVVDVRTRTDATIWGSRGLWRLRLRITYARLDDGWVATRNVASTW